MKTAITVVLFLFTAMVFSQEQNDDFLIEKSTWTIEGNFGFNLRNDNNSNNFNNSDNMSFNFRIAPKLGYALSDNFILGLGVAYGYTEFENEFENAGTIQTDISKFNTYEVFPYAKKFFPINKKLALHLVAETGFSVGNSKTENNDNLNSDSRVERFSINISPGINYKVNDKLLMQANFGSLGYNNVSREFDNSDSQNTNSFGFNFSSTSLTFGVVVLL